MNKNNNLSDPCTEKSSTPETPVAEVKFSYFRRPVKNTLPSREMTLEEAYLEIKSERHQWQTKALRAITGKEQARLFKSLNFDYVTFSGTFFKRNEQGLIQHSGLLTLDIDHVTDLKELKKTMLADTFIQTKLLFISPSGDGLKWIVIIDLGVYTHLQWFRAIAHYLQITYHLEVDASGKDISRACFLPYDPQVIYLPQTPANMIKSAFNVSDWLPVNKNNKSLFTSSAKPLERDSLKITQPVASTIEMITSGIEAAQIDITSKYMDWLNIGFALADELGEVGRAYYQRISRFYQGYSVSSCDQQYDSCLKSTPSSSGKGITIKTFFYIAKHAGIDLSASAGPDSVDEPTNLIFNTPRLPTEIYARLPAILRDSCALFQEGIEQDVFLISSLAVLSGCLPNIEGMYFDCNHSANLYSFITAPAGSGKGKMNWSKYFGQTIHDHLTEQSRNARAIYEKETEKYFNLTKAQRLGVERPVEPPSLMFFIPANSSSSAFTQALSDNNFRGVLFETEADTLADTFKQDWGNFSDVLRKVFHHENCSMFRRKDNKFTEIKDPHIAICVSGTPKQVHNLMPTIENGLFSRFMYYAFEDNSDFKNPFVSHYPASYTDFFTRKGEVIFDLYRQLDKLLHPITFKLTDNQGIRFTAFFKTMLIKNKLLLGRDLDANIKRLGIISFRIAMIITALRILEPQLVTPSHLLSNPQLDEPTEQVTPSHLLSNPQPDEPTEQVTIGVGELTEQVTENSHQLRSPMICSDLDFETAIAIAGTLQKHAIAVFQNMPNNELKGIKLAFYEKLPQTFDRKGYLKIADELGIPIKTADKYIGQFNPNLLKHLYNQYTKIQ